MKKFSPARNSKECILFDGIILDTSTQLILFKLVKPLHLDRTASDSLEEMLGYKKTFWESMSDHNEEKERAPANQHGWTGNILRCSQEEMYMIEGGCWED